MVDLVVLVVVAMIVLAVFGRRRRRLAMLGRGFGSGVREFRRARACLPPADEALDDGDRDGR